MSLNRTAAHTRPRAQGPETKQPHPDTPGQGRSSLYGALSARYTLAGVVISEDAAAQVMKVAH